MKYALVTGVQEEFGRAICIEMARLNYPLLLIIYPMKMLLWKQKRKLKKLEELRNIEDLTLLM